VIRGGSRLLTVVVRPRRVPGTLASILARSVSGEYHRLRVGQVPVVYIVEDDLITVERVDSVPDACSTSAHGVRIEDISDLMGHSGTSITETVYRHEIGPRSPPVRPPWADPQSEAASVRATRTSEPITPKADIHTAPGRRKSTTPPRDARPDRARPA